MTSFSITKARDAAEGYDGPISHTFMVGHRRVTMTFDLNRAQQLSSTWTPSFPRKLSKHEWKQYRAGREVLMGYIADMTSGTIMTVDL
jgi:hypothetical protein